MEQAGYFWNNKDEKFSVTPEGIKINPPDGRKDTGIAMNLVEEPTAETGPKNYKIHNDLGEKVGN